jgi:tetratricopeptide (TPR) repeat protein
MNKPDFRVPAAADLAGAAVFLEAESGPDRTAVLDSWLAQARQDGRRVLQLSGDVEEFGVWAGVQGLLESVLPRMRQVAPELIQRHSYELCLVLPALRRELTVDNPCLTDVATDNEKVRNYPNDRAYRSLHGLIDLLDEWREVQPDAGLAIACDHFDRATPLVHRFFAELLRRRGRSMGLALLLAVAPGSAQQAGALFDPRLVRATLQLDVPAAAPPRVSSAAAAELAAQLEERVGQDRIEWSIHIPAVIRWWQQSDSPERALPWLVRAINLYDHDGLYEIAVRYAPAVEANFDHMYALDRDLHGLAVINLFFCYAALGRPDDAHRLLQTEGLPRVEDPKFLTEIHYFLAMLHARFLARRDQTRAERHLEQALELVARQDISEGQRHFLAVFVRNGLAYVRLKQGRVEEALALCRSGLEELSERLAPNEHRLHRSVLLYNAAQVLGGLDRHAEAIAQLSSAMDMDPNYSEYYLERGALLLKMERFQDAERDLRKAIELSPPYAEVWTDLGQCYRAAGQMADAVHAYTTALDLDPNVVLALIGRAEASVELGDLAAAVDDYSSALALDPDQPLVLAGRAVAYFESDRAVEAVLDLTRAIELAPDVAELYQNRAVALVELGRADEACRRALRAYLVHSLRSAAIVPHGCSAEKGEAGRQNCRTRHQNPNRCPRWTA